MILYGTGIAESAVELFSEFSIAALFLILIGLILIIIEIFRYSKKVFGFFGTLCVLAGIVLRMIPDGTPGMLFVLLFFIIVLLLSASLLKFRFQKREWLYQSIRLAVSAQLNRKENYEFLIDSAGVALTDIDGKGKVAINDIAFFVLSSSPIERGSKVRITKVEGDKIFVTKETDSKTV